MNRLLLVFCLVLPVVAQDSVLDQQAFDRDVKPVLTGTCYACHNANVASGGLNVAGFLTADTIAGHRDAWDLIVRKVKNGEMPPQGVPKPSAEQVVAMTHALQNEFDRIDRSLPPDPGRVTAKRLNRTEYSNTIHDLLGVSFRADRNFPTDDSGHGFDNLGDVLTISPILMEKYLSAAEWITAAALGSQALPEKPLEMQYLLKEERAERLGPSYLQAHHRVEWSANYKIRIGLPGERAADAPPVRMGFWMDGQLLYEQMTETKPSGLVYFDPYSMEEFTLFLPAGDHTFKVGFIDDEFVKTLTGRDAFNRRRNKYIDEITFTGPFAAEKQPDSRAKVLVCDPTTGAACVERIVSTLARRAYRRPVNAAEVGALLQFVDMAKREGLNAEQGIGLALQAMLVSPHFLFRIEHDENPGDPSKMHRISGPELASRLSYFLWSTMPDDTLLGLAEAGKLHEPEVLNAQVKRMLDDERSSALAYSFQSQWLETRNLDSINPDPEKFPTWNPALREAMRTETGLFFEAMLRENRPMSDFLNGRFTYLNETLAQHYGIEGITGSEFRRVELETPERGGILSHASVLAVTSYPSRTSPVLRGKYLLENILGAPPPSPPADVPPLNEAAVGTELSLRKQMEQHRANPACASCHQRMDTLGFGLENYDAIGRWRDKDGSFDVDSSGTFPNGKSFTTPAEMRQILLDDMPEFARCITEKMLIYALGRGLEGYDRRTISEITAELSADDYKFQDLIYDVVQSLPFQMRRGEATALAVRSTTQERSKQ